MEKKSFPSKSKESGDNKNLKDAYVGHLLSKESENPKTSHFFEGIKPKESQIIKKLFNEYKAEEESNKVGKLRENIISSQRNFEEKHKEQPEDRPIKLEEVSEPKKEKSNSSLKNFFKRVAIITPIVAGTIGGFFNPKKASSVEGNETKVSTTENRNIYTGELTLEEEQTRRDRFNKILEDSSDIKWLIEDKIKGIKFIDNVEKEIDSLSIDPIKNKKRLEVLRDFVNSEKRWYTQVFPKQVDDYLLERDSVKTSEIRKSYNEFDYQKKYLREQIQSPEYKRRLMIEFNNDEEKVDGIIKQRLLNLSNDYVLEPRIEEGGIKKGAEAYFVQGEKVHLPDSYIPYNRTTGIHEFEHQLTNANDQISNYAKNLYSESYDLNKIPDKLMEDGQKARDYYGRITERDARKKELEYEMQRLGIKKYGEKFTQEHYRLLMKLQEQGKLGQEIIKFLESTKPQYLEKIMNTIAENKVAGNNNEESLA